MTWRWFDCMTNTYHDIKDEEEMTLTEQVFRKMAGGQDTFNVGSHFINMKNITHEMLPQISSSWEVCAKYLVPFMRLRGFDYVAHGYSTFSWGKVRKIDGPPYTFMSIFKSAEIKDDNIAEAACLAFMQVEL